MSEQPRTAPERLDSWKEIAAYLRRGVTTVQRWESELGLPIRRHGRGRAVFAYRHEIDAWLQRSKQDAPVGESRAGACAPLPPASMSRTRALAAIAGAGIIGAALIGWKLAPLATEASLRLSEHVPLVRDVGFARYPTFSPDGSKLAYTFSVDGERGLFVKALPSGEPVRISPPGLDVVGPRWSPAGDWIAFSTALGPRLRRISVLAPDTGELRGLLEIDHGQLPGEYVGWTPDGSGIVYTAQDESSDPTHIELYDLARGESKRLTTPPPGFEADRYPNVSPDGSRLAFCRCRIAGSHCQPYVRDLSTGREWPVGSETGSVGGLAWTSDSKAIVAAMKLDGPQRLWMFEADEGSGAPPKRLTSQIERAYHPVLRPGRDATSVRIAYEQQFSDDNIWRLDLSDPTSQPEKVISMVGHERFPSISPDGAVLVFAADVSGSEEFWLATGDGQDPKQLTRFGARFVGASGWSADSRSFLVSGPSEMLLYRLPDLNFQRSSARGRHPAWSLDGTKIYGDSASGGKRDLYLFDPKTGDSEQVTFDGGFHGRPGPQGRYLYFTKGRREPIGLYRKALTGGKEELVRRNVRGVAWAVADGAIYYLQAQPGGEIITPMRIWRYRPADGANELVRQLTEDVINVESGFSVTWDGRWAYWSQRDRVQSNLLELTIAR